MTRQTTVSEATLNACNRELFTYDIVQAGWEQEPNGFTANAEHMLTHLAKDGFRKDFSDPELVPSSIAPDNLMYALRIARWAGSISPKKLITPIYDFMSIDGNISPNYDTDSNRALAAHRAATVTLADLIHDESHASTAEGARTGRINKALRCSRLLVASCEFHLEDFDFDLRETFVNRLSTLRDRFGIPAP